MGKEGKGKDGRTERSFRLPRSQAFLSLERSWFTEQVTSWDPRDPLSQFSKLAPSELANAKNKDGNTPLVLFPGVVAQIGNMMV